MWSSLWRPKDRFSLQYFEHVTSELRQIKVVNVHNREDVIDLLQSIVEIVTYGDRQNPLIFESFMEHQVLSEFVRLLKSSTNSRIEASLLQYLSIMIQNMDSEHAIYFCLSNEYINSIIAHQFNFGAGDLALYYVSFLRAVSSKVNRDTLCLLIRVNGDLVVSFPLYTEALKFAQHGEKMIQTAIRALTLNIYNVSDDMVFNFLTTQPASKYFSDLVHSLKEQCLHLDALVSFKEEKVNPQRGKDVLLQTDKIVDDLYYFKDILSVGESRLTMVVVQNLLRLLVFPILLPLLQLGETKVSDVSAVTSLYMVSQLLLVVGERRLVNAVAALLVYPYITLSTEHSTNGDRTNCFGDANIFLNLHNDVNVLESSGCECEGAEKIKSNHLLSSLVECESLHYDSISNLVDSNVFTERRGIFSYIFSDNHSISFLSLLLLIIIVESKELEFHLASAMGLSRAQDMMAFNISDSPGSILSRFMPRILEMLLKILASQPPVSPLIQWHTGWFLRKLLIFQRKMLGTENINIFNTAYNLSRERLKKELENCWFDHILDAISCEWESCKTALEQPSQAKDPSFALELAVCPQTFDGSSSTSSYFAWQRMVDSVKVFVLHLQLKALIVTGDLIEKPTLKPLESPNNEYGKTLSSDASSASFGSEVPLGSGITCRIAFSNAGLRDIYLIPIARGISGKLVLAEKHPFRSQRGVVIAIAPLAGLTPKIDKDHPTWLHLRIREFDPKYKAAKGRQLKTSSAPAGDGRWTLGFPSGKSCEAARLLILEEICKQRSFVESILDPLLQDDYLGNILDNGNN